MFINGLRIARATVRVFWLAGIIALFLLMALPHVLSALDRQMFIVRGGSMEPFIPLGAVIIVRELDPATVQVGDIVTFRTASGTIITHRVVGISAGDELAFQTKGDAGGSADPDVVPLSALVGRVELTVPGLGVVLAALETTSGTLVVLGMLGGLLLAGWFMDELVATLRPSSKRRAVARSAN